MSFLTTTPLSVPFGAEVHGYEPTTEPDPDAAQALRSLLDVHKILLFRGAAFGPAEQVALMGAFGQVIDEYQLGRKWMALSNVDPDSATFPSTRLLFHQDYVFTPWPYPVLSLYATDVSRGVVCTEFVSNHGGYLGLTTSERERFAELRVVNATPRVRDRTDGHRNEESSRTRLTEDNDLEQYFHAEWPLIMYHPRTAEPMLYVTELFGSHILGIDPDDSEDVINRSFDSLYRSDNTYAHDWQPNDLLVWDNVAVQHARGAIEPSTRRTLRRVIVSVKTRDEMLLAARGSR